MNKTNAIKYNAVKHEINVKHSDESTQKVGKKSSKASSHSFWIFSFSYVPTMIGVTVRMVNME